MKPPPAAPLEAPAPAASAGIADERALELALQQAPMAQGVVRTLESNCGGCHGGQRQGDVLGDPADFA